MRAQILLKQNWLKGKLELIQDIVQSAVEQDNLEEVLSTDLEFRNEEEANKLRPSKTNVKEVSYIKNNPRERELNLSLDQQAQSTAAPNSNLSQPAPPMTAQQRERERIKQNLLAPLPQRKGANAPAPIVGGTLGFNKIEKPSAVATNDDTGFGGKNFKQVMDWGTPRLVTKNRALVMDQQQL